MMPGVDITLEPVTNDNWRDCATLAVRPDQPHFVNAVTHYLCLCHYGAVWHPLAAVRDGEVVGFCMSGSTTIAAGGSAASWSTPPTSAKGGPGHDARAHGPVGGRAGHTERRPELRPGEHGRPRAVPSLGFVETGETEDDEIVARWIPS